MKTVVLVFAIALLVSSAAMPAAAQSRVPATGMWGVGGSIGAAVPSDASLMNGIAISGNAEKYVTPRVSIRGQLGASWSDITGRGFTGTITPVYLDANLVYNWEGGVVHPYATAGVGLYRFHSSELGTQGRADTKAGVDVGGGLEYFFTRHATMTGELLYHKVGAFNSSLTTFGDGSFWRFAIGAKTYF